MMLNHPANNDLRLLIVGDYLFEPRAGLLSGPTGAHHICPRLSGLLSCLIEHAGEVTERDELIERYCDDNGHSSRSLTQCIGQLRHYLDDSARNAQYIETVPNRGYRLIAPVYGSTNRPVVHHPLEADTRSHASLGSRVYRLIREFRERKVCRAMLIYTIVIWLVFQVFEVVSEPLHIPVWANSLVVMLGILGFPVAAVLAWIFDLTPGGLVRDSRVPGPEEAVSGRRWPDLVMDSALVSTAVVLCIMLAATSMSCSL